MTTLVIVAALATVACSEIGVELVAGVDYSRGAYDLPRDTVVWSAPVSVLIDRGAWTVAVSGGYAVVDGPATPGGAAFNPSALTTRRRGLTDVTVDVWRTGRSRGGATWYSLGGGFTLPVGDAAKGLGVGDSDQFVHAEAGRDLDPYYLAGGVTYRFIHDSAWRDPVGAWATAHRRVGERHILGVGVDASQRLGPGLSASQGVSLYAGLGLDAGGELNLYYRAGVGPSAGDRALGFTIRKPLGGGR